MLPPIDKTPRPIHERFSAHNFYVGLLLMAWGTIVFSVGQASSVQKSLNRHPTLNEIVTIAQILAVGSGAALVLSGSAIRDKKRWGYFLAGGCALVFILGGVVFFAAFRYLGQFTELEHTVARLYFVRSNFDFIIQFVDGGGLLVFLYLHRNEFMGEQADTTNVET
ncbi:MAG: hypothetical protein AB7K24_22015 [Gemmataceae bacterium]